MELLQRGVMGELEPATFDENEERAFKAKGPWKWIFLAVLSLACVVGFYQWRDRTRQAELKDQIVQHYNDSIAPTAARVNAFREKLEGWIMAVGADVPETRANPRLNLAGLHNASGVYLRIHADSISDDPMAIRDSALTMERDTIGSCLGLAPLSLRGLYERVEFLQPIWLEDAREADTVLRLRTFLDELTNRQERDMPLLADMAEADYFMLAIQHGENRREHPVDIYLWDLHSDEVLLQGRMQSRGTLIPARIAVGNAPAGRANPLPQRSAVADCSIASQIREAAGRPAAEVRSAMPEGPVMEREDAEAPEDSDEAAEDALEASQGESLEVRPD